MKTLKEKVALALIEAIDNESTPLATKSTIRLIRDEKGNTHFEIYPSVLETSGEPASDYARLTIKEKVNEGISKTIPVDETYSDWDFVNALNEILKGSMVGLETGRGTVKVSHSGIDRKYLEDCLVAAVSLVRS